MIYYLIFITFFFYLCYVDKNLSDYIILLLKLLIVNIKRLWWMACFHPKNPITNFIMQIKYDNIAKQLHKELQQNLIQNLKQNDN